MLEQDMASIIKFVLENAGNPAPYYWNVPENFMIPAAFFPTPELETGGETFLTYYVDYVWYIKLFHKTSQGAYSLGFSVLSALKAARNLVPLIAEDGTVIDRSWVRIDDPSLKVLDDGAAQLTISWRSRKPYSDTINRPEKMTQYELTVHMQSGRTVSEAYAEALEKYAIPLNSPGSQPG